MSILPFEEHYSRRRVLVTGDTGFTGGWLCSWLKIIGAEVYGLALPPYKPLSLFEMASIGSICRHEDADIRNGARMSEILAAVRPDFVFHLAAQALVRQSYGDPIETYDTNVIGTANVLNACRGVDSIKAIVVITTDKVYRNNEWPWGYREVDTLGGKDPYSASKAACEIVISSFRDCFFPNGSGKAALGVARAGNIIGGGDWAADRIIPDIVRALAANTPLKIRNPNATRPWQHVLSACHGYLLIGSGLIDRADVVADAWNFGPELQDTRSVSDVIDAFSKGWEKPHINYEPSPLAEAGALMIDSQRARTILGWQPAWRFDETMARTANWYAGYYRDSKSAQQLVAGDVAEYRAVLQSRV